MIIVIADDITGAAELAGIGLRYGLYVLVAADVVPAKDTELLVVYTNTRSMPEPEAVAVMAAMTEKATALQPELMYKKTDSILRGHVLAELQAQMNVLGVKKALLVPVNPSLGRTITGGQYFVNSVPVHLAGFANDPEFPIQHSTIREMLRADDSLMKLAANPAALIEDGITVGEAQTTDDVAAWAAVSETDVLFCGGASFFDALLRTRYRHREQKQQQTPSLRKPLLFVSGTTFRKNRERIKALSHLACFMPDAVFAEPASSVSAIESWSRKAIPLLQQQATVMMAVGEKEVLTDPLLLREKTSEAVLSILQNVAVKEIVIEGGSTAYSIVEKLGWRTFIPTAEWTQGIVRMQVAGAGDVFLTIKPGSYEWPPQWTFDDN